MSDAQRTLYEQREDAFKADDYFRAADDVARSAQEEFQSGKDQFDNVAFFALSAIALISSVAAVLVSTNPRLDHTLAIALETIVVYVFLAFIAHVYRVLSRKVSFAVKMFALDSSHYTVSDTRNLDIVGWTVTSVVGMQQGIPIMVLASLVVSCLAAGVVTVALIISVVQVWQSTATRNVAQAKKIDLFLDDDEYAEQAAIDPYSVDQRDEQGPAACCAQDRADLD